MTHLPLQSNHTFHRWFRTSRGRRCVQSLVVLLTIQGWPLQELSRMVHWHPPAWLGVVGAGLTQLQQALPHWVGQEFAAAHGNAARIFTIDPACAGPGDTVRITGNGFGAKNVLIFVGGQETGHGIITGGLPAQVVSAFGNRATFIVPPTAPGGVTIVWAVQPGSHAGSIAFRVRQAEICGDQIDQDCSGLADDPQLCTPVNHGPQAVAGPDLTVPVGRPVQLDGTASSDPDGNLLTFTWTLLSKPTGSAATLSGATSATPSFLVDAPGAYTAQLTVSDGSLSSSDTVTISTSNSAPLANAGPDTSGQVGATVTLDGSGSSDLDGNALTYSWTLVSKPATSTATLTDPTSVTPSLTIDVFGDYVVRLVVHDGTVSSAADTVTISTLNTAPVAHAGPDQSAPVNETVTLDGSNSSDVDGNPLSYSWSLVSKPSGSTASLQQATTPTPRLTIDSAGTYVVQLVVNDGIASSAPDTVTISTLNSKPVAQAGPDQNGTVGSVIHLDGSASSDVDGDSLTYSWSLTSKPASSTATVQNPTSVTPQFTLDVAGLYVVQLVVHDGTVSSAPATVTITTLNSQPVAHAGADQRGTVGTPITLDGSQSSDVDGDTLTYLWSLTSKPVGSTATLSDPSAVQPTFVIDKPGNYTAQLLVHDGTVTSAPATVTISTLNSKPIANPGPDQHGVVNATITLNGSGSSDVDGDPLTYQWSLTSKPATSTATVQNATSVSTSFVLDKAGTYTAQLIVNDGTVDSDPVTVTITTLNSKPVAQAGPDQSTLVGQTVQLSGQGSSDVDGNPLTYFWALTAVPSGSTATLSQDSLVNPTFVPDLPGTYVAQLIVHDGQLESEPDTVTITVTQPDTTPPPPANLGNITLSPVTNGQVTLTGSAGSVEGGAQVKVTNTRTNQSVTVTANADGTFTLQIGAQNGDTLSIVLTDSANNSSLPATLQVEPPLPPDPATVAPPIDRTVATTVFDATAFLYTGANPIQTGVAPGTIEAKRAAVIRGKVLKKDNTPLSGVTITVLNHPEFGQTLSRADGMFDMAVNGGGLLTFNYAKPGYFPAQRQIEAPWQDYAFLPDVVLIQPDPQVTTIDLTSSAPMQVAAGSPVTDSDGTRQAVLVIPQGTTATMTLPNGITQPLSSLNLRLTEYTIGANGPATMPGMLPPTSSYTYAVELSADEAVSAGATRVQLSQPVPLYVDNFINFPIGTLVPTGIYDRARAAWVPQPNGKVIKLLSVTNGQAELDTDGNGVADDAATLTALGITTAERQVLAQRYPLGRSVWRVITAVLVGVDCNWTASAPEGTIPNGAMPGTGDAGAGDVPVLDTPDTNGSGIVYQNQALSRSLELPGVPQTLHYRSDRQRARAAAYTLQLPLSGATISPLLERMTVTVDIAGQRWQQSFPPQANFSTVFPWDGKDGYGRFVQGPQSVKVTITFEYPAFFMQPVNGQQAFGQASGVFFPGNLQRDPPATVTRIWEGELGTWDARGQGLGGWSLAPYHVYDPAELRLYLGDGSQRSSRDKDNGNLGESVRTAAGGGTAPVSNGAPATSILLQSPRAVASAPDGSVYIVDPGLVRVFRLSPSGQITTVAGGGTVPFPVPDGIPATTAQLVIPFDVAVAPDGALYIIDTNYALVYRVDPSGRIFNFAGKGPACSSVVGGGIPARDMCFGSLESIAVAPDGSVYLGDRTLRRIFRVAQDGRIYTVAGTGGSGLQENVPAVGATIVDASDMAFGPDGSLYFTNSLRVYRIGGDGIIRRVAGNQHAASNPLGDGGPATQASMFPPQGVTVGPEGSVYITENGGNRIRRVTPDGLIATIVGNGQGASVGENVPDTAPINAPIGIALGQDGSLYYAETNGVRRVRRARPALPGFSDVGDIVLPSTDGSEAYVFTSRGKHLRTVNTLTNSVVYSFGYDSRGQLITVTDANTNVTTITRDANGNVTGITGPYGQSNSITLDSNGYLASMTNPNGETTSFSYTADGLLTSATPPGKPASNFQYDSKGRLTQTSDPAGGGETLTRSAVPNGYQVSSVTTGGQSSTYKVEYLPDGQQKRTNTMPDGTVETTQIRTDGSQVVTQADGITQTVAVTGDPRFGLLSPFPTSLAVTTPGGKNGTLTNARTTTLSDPNNPLSLTTQTDTVSFNGRNATRTYNAATRTSTETSPAGRVRTTTVDTQGRVSQQQQGTLAPTSFSYDARGRLSSRSQGGRSTSLTYDTLGRPQTITDSANRTVQFQYDSAGRVTQQTLPDNRVITYTYDGNGNVTSITPPGRPAHSFTYTPVDLEKDYLAPFVSGGGTNTTTYSYNADRQVTGITRPDGQQITLSYAGGKLVNQTFPTGAVSYGYNAQGNLSSASFAGGGTVNYTYDGSLLTQSSWTGPVTGNVTWTYDNNYRKTSQSVNGGNTIAFTYDNDDLLTGAGAMTLTRDSVNGLLSGTTLGTVTDAMTYNPLGEVATSTSSISGSPVLTLSYTRDSLGRISTKTETIQGTTTTYGYTYDTAGRLTEVKHNGNTIATYAYDPNGNRLSKTGTTGTQSGTYDDQDRLLTYNGNTYSYTANGELSTVTRPLAPGPAAYQYDALGNLRSVTFTSGPAIGYVIDGENRRVGKTVNGSLVQGFLYENQLEPVAELDGNGNLVSRFVYCGCGAGNIPQYMLKGGVTYRIIADHLGSPRLVIDSTSGAIVQRMDYDEFGNVILDTNPGFQPFGFAGGIYDRDTGLVRHGARDYDPETGRWTAKDPIRFQGGATNLYEYVTTDPVNLIDPTGEITFGQLMTGLSIIGTIVSIIHNLDWWRQLFRGELSAGEVATAAGWAVIFFATSKFGSNTRLNKQAADALEKVLKERGMKWSVEIAEEWHDFISGQGIEGWKNLVNAAREFLASRFGS